MIKLSDTGDKNEGNIIFYITQRKIYHFIRVIWNFMWVLNFGNIFIKSAFLMCEILARRRVTFQNMIDFFFFTSLEWIFHFGSGNSFYFFITWKYSRLLRALTCLRAFFFRGKCGKTRTLVPKANPRRTKKIKKNDMVYIFFTFFSKI